MRFVQAGHRRGRHPLKDGSGAGAQRHGAVRNRRRFARQNRRARRAWTAKRGLRPAAPGLEAAPIEAESEAEGCDPTWDAERPGWPQRAHGKRCAPKPDRPQGLARGFLAVSHSSLAPKPRGSKLNSAGRAIHDGASRGDAGPSVRSRLSPTARGTAAFLRAIADARDRSQSTVLAAPKVAASGHRQACQRDCGWETGQPGRYEAAGTAGARTRLLVGSFDHTAGDGGNRGGIAAREARGAPALSCASAQETPPTEAATERSAEAADNAALQTPWWTGG